MATIASRRSAVCDQGGFAVAGVDGTDSLVANSNSSDGDRVLSKGRSRSIQPRSGSRGNSHDPDAGPDAGCG